MTDTRSSASAPPEARPSLAERLGEAGWPAWEVLALAAVLAVALLLRFHDYGAAPLLTDNADELQFTWLGLNLITHGDAYTWSYFPGYASYTTLHAFGSSFPMVHDWMDHPPLFGYIIGGFVWLLGVRDMQSVTVEQIRFIPVLCSTATVLLGYLLARPMLGRKAALVGAALLATAPAAVLMGREAEPESAQAVLLLAALLCTWRITERGGGPWAWGVLLVCCAAAPFMKVSGLAVTGICVVILFVRGRWRSGAVVGAAGVGGLLLYVLYGWIVNWTLFVHIFGEQNANRMGVLSAFDFIADATGINRRLRDGWWILGWIGLGLLLAMRGRRRELFLVWPAAAYAATMLVMAGERQVQQYGWYKVMIYPEVYLAAGALVWAAVRRPSLALLTIVLALGGATATNWWLGGLGNSWAPNPVLLVALVLIVLAPAVWAAWHRADARARSVAVVVGQVTLGALLLGNAIESYFLEFVFSRM
jgi:hypothetical protein